MHITLWVSHTDDNKLSHPLPAHLACCCDSPSGSENRRGIFLLTLSINIIRALVRETEGKPTCSAIVARSWSSFFKVSVGSLNDVGE
jgi:hypothetical protein